MKQARAGVGQLLEGVGTGYEVGGSIRDELLGREAKDLDVCVVGSSYEELLRRCRRVGRAAPLETAGQLIGVRLTAPWTPAEGIELALARKEASTGPGHSDFAITLDPALGIADDLGRRDFTCNAIARQIEADGRRGALIDPFGGAQDIAAGILRQVHPHALEEDPLRVLRGLVRCSRDGLRPEEKTLAAMREHAAALHPRGPLSEERKLEQLNKLLAGAGAADALRLARSLDALQEIFPELEPTIGFDQQSKYHRMTVDEHILQVLQRACENDAPLEVRWAALLHDSGKPGSAFRGADGRLHYYSNPDDPQQLAHEDLGARIAAETLRRLRAPRRLTDEVSYLIANHMYSDDDGFLERSEQRRGQKARKFISRHGRERAQRLMLLRRCDRAGKIQGELPASGWNDEISAFEEEVARQLDAPTSRGELAIDGHALLELGFEGKRIGWGLDRLLDFVLKDPSRNTAEALGEQARMLARAQPPAGI